MSYAHDLTTTFARQFRNVVKSERYRSLFPRLRFDKDTESEAVTTQGGGRLAVPVGGSFTGRGADIIVIDDPTKAEDAHSSSGRRALTEWYSRTLLSRLDDKKSGSIIVVSQRLHEEDLPGVLLKESDWQHLDLPAIAFEDERVAIGPTAFHERKKGDALHPEREPLDALAKMKREMGSLTFSAQYLQRPVPVEGNLIKREWIHRFDEPPAREDGARVIQSWDVASSALDNRDYSVCTTWIKIKPKYYLIDLWRGRLEFPALKRKLIELAHRHQPSAILIEEDGPGLHLVQEFRTTSIPGVPMPIGIRVAGDKLVRMEAQSSRFEAGQVYFPKEAPWLAGLLHELFAFPKSRHDDQIDSISQFLGWVEKQTVPNQGPLFEPVLIEG